MKKINIGRAIGAGLAGTMAMTIAMMVAPVLGAPKMDIAAMLGAMLGGAAPAPGTPMWVVGLAMHLVIGSVVLSAGYAFALRNLRDGSPLARGIAYGVIVWLIAQTVVMPMMGAGLFSSSLPHGAMMAIGSLGGHIIYGAVLALIYGSPETARDPFSLSVLGI